MTTADLAIRGTAWLATAGFFLGAFFLIKSRGKNRPASLTKWVWAGACDFYFLHIFAAFHFQHHWSHTAAVRHVAEQSQQLIGKPVEAGIWLNYALLITWAVDAGWLIVDEVGFLKRNKIISWAIHGFIIFMFINGAIIFAPDVVRWPSLAAFIFLAWSFWRR